MQIEGIVQILAVFGVGSLLLTILRYFLTQIKFRTASQLKLAAREIDDDADMRDKLWIRVENLEKFTSQLQGDLMRTHVENAQLKSENQVLTRENAKQQQEIENLQTRLQKTETLLADAVSEINRLNKRLDEAK